MRKKTLRYLLYAFIIGFITINILAANQAWHFTHFASADKEKTSNPEKISGFEKWKTLLLGASMPHPNTRILPNSAYTEISLEGEPKLKAWLISAKSPKGIILLCHGYGGEKSGMLPNAEALLAMGYSCFLLDFAGSGGSSGEQCTIGFKEADQVKRAYDYLIENSELPILLYGSSMGAAAIMRAQAVYQMEVDALILECPYSTMQSTVNARFKIMGIPSFPMAQLLVFWGGTLNGFNAFGLNPVEYAKEIKTPIILMHGKLDPKVSVEDTESIYQNFSGLKTLYTFQEAAHENYVNGFPEEWKKVMEPFLMKLETAN